ncbi:MAG: UDP-N-acetylmuramoyl-L-alanyl-D-glutamate--2,6-diaminopimelate ligase [Nevskiaceae bacterium]|nr:MAG: UDP-N-acetylmuramoyl-L-alanyl-D-glutamate--2,6-diaminopimelate ligase [Nevskiaceae bacterium]TBR73381.1 MAG: UDP-N-acetylmuramoyl-L-alanyl-D-glutamate--2,6-diaminopimelate ligase [Nevskiaceae bacterium]
MATRALSSLLAGYTPASLPDGLVVTDVEADSRKLRAGALFLACAGSAQHGLAFAERAVAAGAAAVAWEPAPGITAPALAIPAFRVEQLRAHSGEIAARFFGQPSDALRVTGITGTDGKTSTAHLLAQALETLGRPCLYIGTLGTGRVDALAPGLNTTPGAVDVQRTLAGARDAGLRDCAMEVSSIALDQGRVNGVHYTATVLTNIGRDHLDYHGTLENYAAAKRKLFGRGDGAVAVLNRDDAHGRRYAAELAGVCPVAGYALDDAEATCVARHVETHGKGLRFEVVRGAVTAKVDSPLLGRFNVYNLLAAATVLAETGVPLADACQALSQARTVPGRAEAFHGPASAAVIVVDYAHTPQALENILQALREHATGRVICVFGCGGDRDRGKRPLMGAAVARNADAFIITDDNPRTEGPTAIVTDIRAGLPAGACFEVCEDRARAIREAVASARRGDIVLVAGKGHEDYQIYGHDKRAFSDRALAAELVGMECAA